MDWKGLLYEIYIFGREYVPYFSNLTFLIKYLEKNYPKRPNAKTNYRRKKNFVLYAIFGLPIVDDIYC